MNIKTSYKEIKNEEKNGLELYFDSFPTLEDRNELKKNGFKWNATKKCWYTSLNTESKPKTEIKNESFQLLSNDEALEIAKKLWDTPKMQDFLLEKYDFYKTKDNLIIELEKVNKITIDKTMWYDDETEGPTVNENNFISYNKSNVPGRNLEAYLEEKESLEKNGCASGQYDYNGIYFVQHYYNNDLTVGCNWMREKDEKYFKRYLTEEEQKDYIKLMGERKNQYIERLKKYFQKYGKKYVHAEGYWVNR